MTKLTRRSALRLAAATPLAAPLAAPAIAAGRIEWRLATSWPRNLPGPGVTADRLAKRIETLSDGRLRLKLFAAGELVPAFEVLDAVAAGTVEAGHSASFFWQGKLAGAVFYTTVPFGLTPDEHMAWLQHGEGQALWDELYASYGVKPFIGGNTGPCMGGFFRKALAVPDDLRGLKIRVQGLGGEVFRRLGATPVSIAPGEIGQALASGTIDAVEFLSPASDLAQGFHRAARNYAWPGFNKPNGASEFLVSRAAYDALPADLKAVVEHACLAEAAFALGEIQRQNEAALARLTGEGGVTLMPFAAAIMAAAAPHATAVVDEAGDTNALAGKIRDSYKAALTRGAAWSKVSLQALLTARNA